MTDQSPLHGIELPDDKTRPTAPLLEHVLPHQKAPGRHLRMIHEHHRQNMRQVRQAMDMARAGQVSAANLKDATAPLSELQLNYRRFGALCGQECQMIHGHHSIEDAHVFPALSEKAIAFRRVVQRLMDEHEVVHALLVRLIEKLNALFQDPSATTFDDAVIVYEALEKLLLSHFGYEENSIGDALGVFEIGV